MDRPVLVIVPCNLPEKQEVDFDRILLFAIYVMDKVVENEYTLVFCQTHMSSSHRPSFNWLRKNYHMFLRKYKKNLKSLIIVHPNTFTRVTLKLFKPFISSKFWKKLVYIENVTDIYKYMKPDQLTLPDVILSYKRKDKAQPIFGVSMHDAVNRTITHSGLPTVCERAFEVLDTKAADVEGIFRISGSKAAIQELRLQFDRGEDIDLTGQDVHVVSGLLKLFLGELPEPLLTFDLYNSLIATHRKGKTFLEVQDEVKALLELLPMPNLLLCRRLFALLSKITKNSEVNKMNASNLAIVFGPTLLRAPSDRLIADAGVINLLVRNLIEHYASLFEPV
jgi:Rho GTPase-activating protein 1